MDWWLIVLRLVHLGSAMAWFLVDFLVSGRARGLSPTTLDR